MYELYLAHHGILGQKWGVRRYQNADGSLTAAGKLRYAPDGNGGYRKLSGSERRAAEKAAKRRTAALEKARKARIEKAEYEKGKQEALKTGDASKIDKYFNDLSPEEQRQTLERMRTKQEFQRMLNNEAQLVSQGKSKMDQLMDGVSKATDWSEKGIRMYNVIAKVNNAFNSETYMPSIGGEWAGDRKSKLEKQRREEAEKAAADKAEKQRQKWLRNASLEDIVNNPGHAKLEDWGNIGKRAATEKVIREMVKNQKDAQTKAAAEKTEQAQKASEERAAKQKADAEARAAKQKADAEARDALKALRAEARARRVDEALFHTEAKRRAAERQARKRLKNSFSSVTSSSYYDIGAYGFGF